MRVAIVSDIHANVAALAAVLADIDTRGVDDIVHLGDLVGYNSFPSETLALVQARSIRGVHGNHDLMTCGVLSLDHCGPLARRASFGPSIRAASASRGTPIRERRMRWWTASRGRLRSIGSRTTTRACRATTRVEGLPSRRVRGGWGSASGAAPWRRRERSLASSIPLAERGSLDRDGTQPPHQGADAALDPTVHDVAHVRPLLHGVLNRPGLDWRRVEVAEQQHVLRGSAEALTDRAALRCVHDEDDVGGAHQVRHEELGAVPTQIDAAARGNHHGVGRRGAARADEPGRVP